MSSALSCATSQSVLSFAVRELLSAGRRLVALGEDVLSIEATLKVAGVSLTDGLHPQQQVDMGPQYHNMDLKTTVQNFSPLDAGSRLARGSAADLDGLKQSAHIFKGLGDISQQHSMREVGSSSKRKWEDSRSETGNQTQYVLRNEGFENCRSREQMPPPAVRIQQSFASRDRSPSLDFHSLDSQRNHDDAARFPQVAITPLQHSSGSGLNRSMLVPGSSMERSKMSSTGARGNTGQSRIDHHQSACVDTGSVGPVYTRGGWQPLAEFFNTERSGEYSSPSSSLPSTGQAPVRRFVDHQQGSFMFPIDRRDRTVDPSSRSHQSVDSDGSSLYHRSQSAFIVQSQLESPALSHYHSSIPNREGRITLSRIPSFAGQYSSNKGIGLSSHIRSSSCHTNNQFDKPSSSHRQQLVTATTAHQPVFASPHFSSTRHISHSSSLHSVDGSRSETLRRSNSLRNGLKSVNGEMRPCSSANMESLLSTQISRVGQTRGRVSLTESQASGPRRLANR